MKNVRQAIRGGVLAAAMSISAVAGAQAEPVKMRISVDGPAQQTRTKLLSDYAAAVNARAGDRLYVELFHSGQLFNDRDAIKAIHQGAVEMVVPFSTFLSSVIPNFNYTGLPVFYGVDIEQVRAFADGELGRELDRSLEEKLDVKVLGPWMELGSANIFTVAGKPVNTYRDLDGMTIRSPGGAGLERLFAFFKAKVVNVPLSDVPLALSQGKIDGLATSPDTLAAGKLWESGIRHGFEASISWAHYVPMVNRSFWDRLPSDLQKVLTDTWQEQVPAQRAAMAAAQARARDTLIANGVEIVTPDRAARAAVREEMLQSYERWVEAVGIAPDFAERVRQAFGASR